MVSIVIKKSVDNLKKEHFFSKLKNKCASDDEIQRTKEIIKLFDIKNGEELTELYLKSDVIFLTDIFENLIKSLFKYMELILYIE